MVVGKERLLMYVILVYDIVTDDAGKKILPKVFKICKKYLTHIITALKNELKQFIRKDVDSVILFSSRDERWLKKEFIGLNDDKTSRFI